MAELKKSQDDIKELKNEIEMISKQIFNLQKMNLRENRKFRKKT